MKSVYNYKSQRRFFNVYMKLPLIAAITIIAAFFIWAVVDTAVFTYETGYGFRSKTYYGIMMLPSGFLNWFVWVLIGEILSWSTYFLGTMAVSYKFMVISNLEKISGLGGDVKENKTASLEAPDASVAEEQDGGQLKL